MARQTRTRHDRLRHPRWDERHESTGDSRRKSHPLFWVLVLIAILTIVWSVYNRWASETTPAQVQPAAPPVGPAHRAVSRALDAQPARPGREARSPGR